MGALRQTTEVDMQGSFDEVGWEIEPEGERKLAGIPALVSEVLFFASREAVRNAARHGRQKGAGTRLFLSIGLKYQNGIAITIEDNGGGFAIGEPVPFAEVRASNLIGEVANPGSSGLAYNRAGSLDGGSGQGLALHSTMMAVIGGFLSVESAPGQYTRVTLELPESAWQSWE